MYEYTDKIIKRLNYIAIKAFAKVRAAKMDELNIIAAVNTAYETIDRETKRLFHKIIDFYGDDSVTDLMEMLDGYNPLTKYVYTHEIDRKRARLIEALISTRDPKEATVALREWSRMIAQYALEVTDEAYIDRLRQEGVKRVRWVTVLDSRTCRECVRLDGKVFDIDKVPVKPHWNCRCYVIVEDN